MKRIGTLVLAAMTVRRGIHAGTAYAGAAEGSWYIAPQVNALWLDDGRVADDDAGVTLAFGRTLSANWDAQISLFGSEHQRAGDDSLELQGFGLSLNRVFYREGRVNPFLSLGVARKPSPSSSPGADEDNLTALYGARPAHHSRRGARRRQRHAAARGPRRAPRA